MGSVDSLDRGEKPRGAGTFTTFVVHDWIEAQSLLIGLLSNARPVVLHTRHIAAMAGFLFPAMPLWIE